jgi:hypothetical protein
MADQSTARSVKIDADERGAWSSDRPRTDRPPRPVDISTRCRMLQPSDRMRYSPGSLVVLVCPSVPLRERFAERVFEDRSAVMSMSKVRKLIAGRVPADELEDRAWDLLQNAIGRRLEAGDAVVLVTESMDPLEREPVLHAAAKLKRPRHLLLVEPGRDAVEEDDLPALNELRRQVEAGEVGNEGFQTALRVSGKAVGDLKRIVFRSAPRED